MKKNILIFALFAFVALLFFAGNLHSISAAISPASVSLQYSPNYTYNGTFNVIDTDVTSASMTAVTNSPYVNITSPKIFTVLPGASYPVTYQVTLPDNYPPGKSSIFITVTKAPDQTSSNVGIAIAFNYVVFVERPYPAQFVEASGPTINVADKNATIEVTASNKGSLQSTGVKAYATIYDNNNAIGNLQSSSADVDVGSSSSLQLLWSAPGCGVYPVDVWLTYGDNNKSNVLKSNIDICQPTLLLDETQLPTQIKSGGIRQFAIPVRNSYNQPISASATLKVMDGNQVIAQTQPSAVVSIDGRANSTIPVFVDATTMPAGLYNVEVDLTYGGKTLPMDFYNAAKGDYDYKLEVLAPTVVVPPTGGNNTSGTILPPPPPKQADNTVLYIVIFVGAVIVLVALAVFLGKKKPQENVPNSEEEPSMPHESYPAGSKDKDDEE